MGGGVGRTGDTCGTVTGALMVIGLKHGSADPDDHDAKMKTYELARAFIQRFKELNKSIACRELIGFDIGTRDELTSDDWVIISRQCPIYLADAAEILKEIL